MKEFSGSMFKTTNQARAFQRYKKMKKNAACHLLSRSHFHSMQIYVYFILYHNSGYFCYQLTNTVLQYSCVCRMGKDEDRVVRRAELKV